MAPSDFGPKMRMMGQKDFWKHTKTYFTFTTNRLNHGSSVAFKADDREKAKGGRGGKGHGRGRGGRRFFKSRRKKRATTRRTTVNLRTGPGSGKMVGQASQMQQIHGNHGIRNQPMSLQKVTNLKVEARKVRKVRRLRMVKTRKALGSCRLHSHGVGGLAVFRGR